MYIFFISSSTRELINETIRPREKTHNSRVKRSNKDKSHGTMGDCSSESTESGRDAPIVFTRVNKRMMTGSENDNPVVIETVIKRRKPNSEKEHPVRRKKKCQMSNRYPRRTEVRRSNSSDDDNSSRRDDDGGGDDDDDQDPYSRLSEDEATHRADAPHTESDDADIEYDTGNNHGNDSDNNDSNDSNDDDDDDNIVVNCRLRPLTTETALAQKILSDTAGNIYGMLGKLDYHMKELQPKLETIKVYSRYFSEALEKIKDRNSTFLRVI